MTGINDNPSLPKPSWAIRRRFMFATAAFCAAVIAFILIARLDTGPADTAITMAFLVLMSIVGCYVFGAAWEDISLAKFQKGPAPRNHVLGEDEQ